MGVILFSHSGKVNHFLSKCGNVPHPPRNRGHQSLLESGDLMSLSPVLTEGEQQYLGKIFDHAQ